MNLPSMSHEYSSLTDALPSCPGLNLSERMSESFLTGYGAYPLDLNFHQDGE